MILPRNVVAAAALSMLLGSGQAWAAGYECTVFGDKGTDMVADALIVRPVGLIATAFGTAVWVVSLPFTLPSDSTGEAGRELVGKPAAYTFDRPLGDFRTSDSCRNWVGH